MFRKIKLIKNKEKRKGSKKSSRRIWKDESFFQYL
jgi:hypothetical protein